MTFTFYVRKRQDGSGLWDSNRDGDTTSFVGGDSLDAFNKLVDHFRIRGEKIVPIKQTQDFEEWTVNPTLVSAPVGIKTSFPQRTSLTPGVCPSCKGSGNYVGLFDAGICKDCGGTGRA